MDRMIKKKRGEGEFILFESIAKQFFWMLLFFFFRFFKPLFIFRTHDFYEADKFCVALFFFFFVY